MKFLGNGLALLVLGGASIWVSAATLTVKSGESIQAAVNQAQAGDTIEVYPGTYHETVYIDKNDIHLKGIVKEGEWAVLDGEHKLNDGVLLAGHGGTIERLFIKHYKGNGIMTQGGNNFSIIYNRVIDTGVYGIFPQFGKNGLVAYNELAVIEDAAIYVGMCDNVDVLYNETYDSVMGIETENSRNMLVEGNNMHHNTVGIMISLVPGLPIKTAERTIVRNNFISDNNHDNFAPEGAIAAGLPKGVGLVIYGADSNIVENNIFRNNNSAAILVADHAFMVGGPADPDADPRPDKQKILNNMFINNGSEPEPALLKYLQLAGLKQGPDLLATGKGRKNCVSNAGQLIHVGIERWGECAVGETSVHIETAQLDKPVESPALTLDQKGRLTYLGVCSGCHAYTQNLIGPPMLVVKALYQGRPEAMAEWIANPTHKRSNFPPMPSQAYLPDEVRLQVAKYILDDLEN